MSARLLSAALLASVHVVACVGGPGDPSSSSSGSSGPAESWFPGSEDERGPDGGDAHPEEDASAADAGSDGAPVATGSSEAS